MNRSSIPSVEDLLARLARATAEVSELTAENQQLNDRILKLEEELALARLHRFAPRSEKRQDRILNEAEQIAQAEGDVDLEDDHADVATPLPDTGLPPRTKAEGKKRGRKPLPESLPRERVEYDIPEDQKSCPCCSTRMHRMGEIITEQLHPIENWNSVELANPSRTARKSGYPEIHACPR